MLPTEVQATIGKILFFIFATCALCLAKVRAAEPQNLNLQKISQQPQTISYVLKI